MENTFFNHIFFKSTDLALAPADWLISFHFSGSQLSYLQKGIIITSVTITHIWGYKCDEIADIKIFWKQRCIIIVIISSKIFALPVSWLRERTLGGLYNACYCY